MRLTTTTTIMETLCRYLCPIPIATVFLLSGCATKIEYRDVYKTKYIVVEIPSSLTKPVAAIPPPDKDEWIKSSDKKQVSLLQDVYFKSLASLNTCNKKLSEIEGLNQITLKSVNDLNQKVKDVRLPKAN